MMSTDPKVIDPLKYLNNVNGHHSPQELVEHYHALRPSLFRLRGESPPAFDVAVRETNKRLKIKSKTILADLAMLTPPPPSQDPKVLLDAMGQTHLLRLAQDFREGILWYGVLAGESKLLLNSQRDLLTLDRLPADVRIRDDGFDLCRISKEAILRFLGDGGGPDLELLPDLRGYFARFAVFRDTRVPLLLATWTLGTYCYRIFRVFQYLVLRSPDKRCGKTRVLDEITLVAFNASGRVVHPTEAQVFRGPSRNGGTLLLDEVESLGQANADIYAGLLAVLNSGFEQGGSVPRLEKTAAGNYREVSYETYCPRALAGIKKLVETLEDRAIQITMQRKLKREKVERFSPPRLAHEAQRLRDRCYLWALTHAADIAEIYDEADHTFHEIPDLDDRARDLWEPLFSLVSVADASRDEAALPLTTELMSLAKALGTVREHSGGHAITGQIIHELYQLAADPQSPAGVDLEPVALAERLRVALSWEKLSSKYLADLLGPLGLHSERVKMQGTTKRMYRLRVSELAELSERYGPDETDEKKDE